MSDNGYNENYEQDILNEDTQEEEVKPVKLSRKATGCIAAALVFILLILFITIRSCTLEKKVNTSSTIGTTISATIPDSEQLQNGRDEATENLDFSENSQVVTTTSSEEIMSSWPARNTV